jgi:hypothetical protein
MRRVKCVGCSYVFEYEITRVVQGGGHSAFFLNNRGAAADAQERAKAKLQCALDEAVEPFYCPKCGIYQPDMVRVLRERLGKRCEPNKYASERITVPMESAWRAAYAADTIESYTKFKEVWPTFGSYADHQIKEIKYPREVRKLVGGFGWIVWGVLVTFIVGWLAWGFLWWVKDY